MFVSQSSDGDGRRGEGPLHGRHPGRPRPPPALQELARGAGPLRRGRPRPRPPSARDHIRQLQTRSSEWGSSG